MLGRKSKKYREVYETKRNSRRFSKFKPFYIHLSIIIAFLLFLVIYFADDLSFNFYGTDDDSSEIITLSGDLKFFNEPYEGAIKLYSSDFVLEMDDGRFDISSKDVTMDGFKGRIYLMNESLVLDGNVNKIEYGNNVLRLGGKHIVLTSLKKVDVDFDFSKLILEFEKGNVKLEDTFNFDITNTTVILNDFDCSFNYDGEFLFTGTASSFALNSLNPKLNISYTK